MVTALFIDLEISQNPLGNVFDIRRALAQIRIRNAPHGLQEILHHRIEGKLGVLLTVGDRIRHFFQQGLVLQQHHVRFEDLAVRTAGE